MIERRSFSRMLFRIANVIFLIFLALCCLIPFTHVLFASVSSPTFLSQNRGLVLYPHGFSLNGYDLVFRNPNLIPSYFNTIFYVVMGTLLNLLMTSVAAYVLSRKGPMLNKFFMKLITFTMFFGGGIVPFFLVVDGLGMTDTRLSQLIPYAVSTYNIIIMRTSFQQVPVSLEESARIDGANDFTILFRIIMPLSKAVLAVITLFVAVSFWNSWFPSVLFLRDRSLFPLQLILREILINNDVSKVVPVRELSASQEQYYRKLVKYCIIVVATLPIVCIYPFLQKYFVKGVMIGSIKE
ncbi:MAG: carbohydrate ABC transporter permease [Acutalibacteraceae bacterium]|jgi:putative aldouronate transport system permease protein